MAAPHCSHLGTAVFHHPESGTRQSVTPRIATVPLSRAGGRETPLSENCSAPAVLGRQTAVHQRAHVLKRRQRHDLGNDDRARQRPALPSAHFKGTQLGLVGLTIPTPRNRKRGLCAAGGVKDAET